MSFLSHQGTLNKPVGDWVNNVNELYKEPWVWWWSEKEGNLYRFLKGKWDRFIP